MAIASRTKVRELAVGCCDRAVEACDVMNLSEGVNQYGRKGMSVSTLPISLRLGLGWGFQTWAVILSVDMVGSSRRAERIGPRDTYVTMHTYLPVMAYLAARRGRVVGLRGDGLFAAFGLKEVDGEYEAVTGDAVSEAVANAARTGRAMIEACDILGGVLEDNDVEGGISVRVGIDSGNIVVTRIGLDDAQEITAYGTAVNNACKMRNDGRVTVSHRTNRLWNGTPGGKIVRRRHGGNWVLRFEGLRMLS